MAGSRRTRNRVHKVLIGTTNTPISRVAHKRAANTLVSTWEMPDRPPGHARAMRTALASVADLQPRYALLLRRLAECGGRVRQVPFVRLRRHAGDVEQADRAGDLRKPPVRISGFGAQDAFRQSSIANFDSGFWHGEIESVGRQAFAMAEVERSDVDALMCYDNFTPTVLFSLEGLGYCPRGEGGRFVEGGTLRLGGGLPTNTDGGHLSNSYMQGWALNVEAVRQARGECGERQVPDCEVVQYVQATPCTRVILYTAD